MYRCRHTHPLVCCCIKLQRCTTGALASLVSSVSDVRMSAGQLINANHPKDCLCSYRLHRSCRSSQPGSGFFLRDICTCNLLSITPGFVERQADSFVSQKLIGSEESARIVVQKNIALSRKIFEDFLHTQKISIYFLFFFFSFIFIAWNRKGHSTFSLTTAYPILLPLRKLQRIISFTLKNQHPLVGYQEVERRNVSRGRNIV